ncbi:hypothetical protein [Amycolatopsis sp. VC5-11]|uniref:hypothetical protein n=1 Tax=Amycolatopsis sp. VC5-11 TaxID=3120156 RepID=UPI00300BCA46
MNLLREAGFSIEELARLDNGELAWRIRRTDDDVSWVVIAWAARALAFRLPTAVLDCVNPPRVLDAADGIGIPPEQIAAVRREWLLFTGDFPLAANALLRFEKDNGGRAEPPSPSAV